MTELQEYIEKELKKLDRGIVTTPHSMSELEMFAKANHGSSDIVLMHMSINYGYKLALENLKTLIP
jgi:hypothetical protein